MDWKEIIEFPGYLVSDEGDILRSGKTVVHKNGVRAYYTSKIMTQYVDRYGYKIAYMRKGDKNFTVKSHILVARAFMGPSPHNKNEVNHKDFDKTNNHINNLEWMSRQENAAHLGKHRRRYSSGDVVEMGKRYSTGETMSQTSKHFKCDSGLIHKILNGKTYRDLNIPKII